MSNTMRYFSMLSGPDQCKAMTNATEHCKRFPLGKHWKGLQDLAEQEAKKIWEANQSNRGGFHINGGTIGAVAVDSLQKIETFNNGAEEVSSSPSTASKRGHDDIEEPEESTQGNAKCLNAGDGKSFKLRNIVSSILRANNNINNGGGSGGRRSVAFAPNVRYTEKRFKKSSVTTWKQRLAETEDLEDARAIGFLALDHNAELRESNARHLRFEVDSDSEYLRTQNVRLRRGNDRLRKEREELR